jgi:pilus assembly protein FimV
MVRILRGGAALAVLVAATFANAAGLGKLTVNSALGQVLHAEIDLVALQPGEEDSLTAHVAPPEAFRDARIEYSPVLRTLRFAVDKRPNGQPFLKVTSVAPVNEPFVDVLIEVTWPAGRLQREYPILLDPPGYAQSKPVPPTVAAAPTAPSTAAAPKPAQAAPATPAPAAQAPAAGAQAPSGAPSASGELAAGGGSRAAPVDGAAAPGSDTYGPVQRGDTLAKIAENVKPASVSLEQMLVALYRENKGAFVNNNMNRLKTGQILKVPPTDDVQKIENKDATREYRTHVADWKTYRDQLASGAAAIPTRPESTNTASGRVSSAAVTPPPAANAPSGDVLRLSKSEAGNAASTRAGGGGQARLDAMQEELTAKDKALREAQSRVADLEKQIRDMQRLIELKGGAPGKAESKVAVAPPPPATKPAEAPKVEAKPAPAPVAPAEPPKPAVVAESSKPSDTTKPGESKTTTTTTTTTTEAGKNAPPPPPKVAENQAAPKKAPKQPVAPPPSLVDELTDNPLVLYGGIGALVLGLGAILFMRRRRERDEDETPSRMTSSFPSDLKATTATGRPAAGLVDTGNSSFLTDFDKTGPGTIDTDEVDPVAEAEVYIAYGRDAQAEEILKEAMARDRNRHEIALKLLEIYHARKSATAFENVARELRASVGEDSPMWHKAAAMGAQIDPTNPLYGGAAGAAGAVSAMAPLAPTPRPDLDFDIDASHAPAHAAAEPSFDLDLDAGRKSQEHAAPASLDFDLEHPSETSHQPIDVPLEPAKEEKHTFDFDLSGLDFPGSGKSTSVPDLDLGHEPAHDVELADLNLEPASTGAGSEGVGTKLELAKAYLEIGDKDGAREILQEVAKEGSNAQRAEAEKLMATL